MRRMGVSGRGPGRGMVHRMGDSGRARVLERLRARAPVRLRVLVRVKSDPPGNLRQKIISISRRLNNGRRRGGNRG